MLKAIRFARKDFFAAEAKVIAVRRAYGPAALVRSQHHKTLRIMNKLVDVAAFFNRLFGLFNWRRRSFLRLVVFSRRFFHGFFGRCVPAQAINLADDGVFRKPQLLADFGRRMPLVEQGLHFCDNAGRPRIRCCHSCPFFAIMVQPARQ